MRELKFKGVEISSTIMDKPLDSPELDPFFAKMNEYNLPILIHPRNKKSGSRAYGFYPGKKGQERPTELLATFPFNWTFETTVAMGCLVMGGVLNKYRNLKIITHHLGGLVPYQATRIKRAQYLLTPEERVKIGTDRSLYEWYQSIYGDTALWGNTAALLCGLDFFGVDHVLFGTDMPFGSRGGEAFLRDAIRSIEEAGLSEEARKKIYELNARKLFAIPV